MRTQYTQKVKTTGLICISIATIDELVGTIANAKGTIDDVSQNCKAFADIYTQKLNAEGATYTKEINII